MPLLDPLSSVTTALERERIIPDVVPASFIPSLLFSIIWPNGKEAMLGNELTKDDTVDEPTIQIAPMAVPVEMADSGGESLESGAIVGEVSYTLVMVDPDAPSHADPKYGQFRHWVLPGLKSAPDQSTPAADFSAMATKPALTPYRPPGPGPGTGLHRYIFLLFQESLKSPLVVPANAPEYGGALEQRRNWNAVQFGNKYGLKLSVNAVFADVYIQICKIL